MMKKIAAVALVTLACVSGSLFAQTSVGVSIGINQPGVYGRIDIGNYPQPVYFVQEQWVRERYQQAHPQWRGEGRDGSEYYGNKHGKKEKHRGRDD